MGQFLIVGDVDHIQNYVFASGRLRAIRGASVLLDHAAEHVKTKLSRPPMVTFLRWLGGQIVVRLPDASEVQAEQMCAAIEQLFRHCSPGEATITTAYELYDGVDFQGALSAAFRKVQEEKTGRQTSGPVGEVLLTSPYDRRCDLLPSQAATYRQRREGDEYRMSYAAHARWIAVRRPSPFEKTLKRKFSRVGIPNGNLPYHTEDLWEGEGEGQYVGLVMADGNAFGRMLETIRAPTDYANFSAQLYHLTLTAVAQATAQTKIQSFRNKRGMWLPLVPIILAGDDLAVLVRAEHAITFAAALCEKFYALSGSDDYRAVRKVIAAFRQQDPSAGAWLFPSDDERQWQLTLSAGIAIAKRSFPISALRRFAIELRASAKRGLRRCPDAVQQCGMIDFAVITTATVQPLDDLRRAFCFDETPQELSESLKEWTHLTARPYTVQQFGQLRLLAETLKKLIPRSQRKFLYRELFRGRRAGKEAFSFLLFRQRRESTSAILQLLQKLGCEVGQMPFGAHGVTPLVDALELAELDTKE